MKNTGSVFIFAIITFFCLAATKFETSNKITGYKVGDKVADFSLKNIDGKMVSMSNFKDAKGFIIVFTCNHCPFAKMYEDRIISLNSQFLPQGFPLIAINPNNAVNQDEDSFENMVARAKEKFYTFPYLQDQNQEVANRFGASRTPHAFVLLKKGHEFEIAYIGAIDDKPDNADNVNEKYVKNAVNQLLQGQHIVVNTTKAVGCTIK
jgi:glutathione peroxidase-family protein